MSAPLKKVAVEVPQDGTLIGAIVHAYRDSGVAEGAFTLDQFNAVPFSAWRNFAATMAANVITFHIGADLLRSPTSMAAIARLLYETGLDPNAALARCKESDAMQQAAAAQPSATKH
jgi:hypothetical protein